MPFRRLFEGMADLTKERLTERVPYELEGQGQTVLIEPTWYRECWSAIEIKRDGESLLSRIIGVHGAI